MKLETTKKWRYDKEKLLRSAKQVAELYKKHCVQCHEEVKPTEYMTPSEEDQYFGPYICYNPKCPNFGLYQIPVENLPLSDE